MTIAALIRAMAAAGAPPEAIALAVEAVEGASAVVDASRAAARERKRRQRERDMSRDGHVTVTAEDVTDPAPSPLPLLSPQTPQITPTPLPHPEGKPARTRGTWACPEGINPDHWRDVLANRKAKRLALTPTAYEYQLREIGKLSDDEWPPGRLVEHAAQMGWAGIHDPRDAKNRPHAQRPRHDRRNGNGFLDAIIDDERADRAGARV